MTLPTMASLASLALVSMCHHAADAFTLPRTRRTELKMVMGNLPNPFSSENTPEPAFVSSPDSGADYEELDLTSTDGLIARAKIALASDLGVQNGNLLAENFVCIGPFLDKPLNKFDYLAAGRFFDLRSTFPDLDYRAHDYRIDKVDPMTVRVTARTVGTMRGELRLRDQVLPPNGQQLRCPPEAISITFDPSSGKIVKLCTGFAMDRLVGNTNGLCGVMAAATVAGEPPSDWEIYPVLTVAQRFFGRPVAQIGESTSFLAPFPETVMIQLAKGILSSNMAAEDANLLASDFTYMTPTQGPMAKKKFLEEFAEEEFAGVEPELSHFRVDPYDPNRVWVDMRPIAPGFEGPPQAMSFTFDDDGFCKRITSSAVMDPTLGNAGGLGGPEGYRYATGTASLGIATRPLSRAVSRLQKTLLSPITGTGVDDYIVQDPILPLSGPSKKAQSPVETLSTIKADRPVKKAPASQPPAPEKPKPAPAPKAQVPKVEAPKPSIPKPAAPKATVAKAAVAKKPAPMKPSSPKKPAASKSTPRPSFSILKLPTLSLSSPPTLAKKPSTLVAKSVSTTKKEPIKRKEPTAKSPTFPVIKIPTLSLSSPPSEGKQSSQKASDAQKKVNYQKKAAAEKLRQQQANKQEEERRQAVAKAKLQREEQLRKERGQKQAELETQQEATKKGALLTQQQRATKAAQTKKEQQEKRKAEAEEKRAAQAEARRQQQEARKAAVEQKRTDAGEKRAAQAEARRQQEEKRKAEVERKREEAEAIKLAAAKEVAKEAERKRKGARKEKTAAAASSSAEKAKSGATIPLFGFGGGGSSDSMNEDAPVPKVEKRLTINLFGGNQAPRKSPQRKAEDVAKKAQPGATITLFGLGGDNASAGKSEQSAKQQRAAKAADSAKKAVPGATINLFGFGGGESKLPTTASKAKLAASAAKRAEKAKPGATINLFGFNSAAPASSPKAATKSKKKAAPAKKATPVKKKPAPKPAAAKPKPKLVAAKTTAPRGVPTISGWRKNGDSSITGSIRGSKSFSSGERVTTSPITQGTIASGNVVKTVSGSRYFLS